MKTSKFKTNAKCGGCTSKIDHTLNERAKESTWSFDLKDPDRVLTITTDLPPEDVIKAVNEAGYKAEEVK